MSKIPESEGGVPPVTPVHRVVDRRHSIPELKKIPVSRRDTPAAEEKTDGFSLADISAAQATELLALPLMSERAAGTSDYFKALEDRNFQLLKSGLRKIRDGAKPENLEIAMLVNASQVTGMLTTATTPQPLFGELQQFNDVASGMGTPNRIRRG